MTTTIITIVVVTNGWLPLHYQSKVISCTPEHSHRLQRQGDEDMMFQHNVGSEMRSSESDGKNWKRSNKPDDLLFVWWKEIVMLGERVSGVREGLMDRGLVDRWVDGWVDGCMDVWMNVWMDGWMDRWMYE